MTAAAGITTSAQPPTAVVQIQPGMNVQPVVLVDANGQYVTPGGSTTAGSLATTTLPVNVAAATAPTAGQALIATSATAATWQAVQVKDIPALKAFSIVDYGADPTGVTASTTAITAAKTAAGAGSRNIILVPPGTYLTGPMTFDGFHWLGYGPRASVFKATSGSLDWFTNTGYASGSVNANETETVIEGLGFNGANLSGTNSGNLYGSDYAGSVGGSVSGSPCVVAVGNGFSGTFNATVPTFIFRDCEIFNGPGIGFSTEYSRGGLPSTQTSGLFVHDNGSHGCIFGSDQVHSGPVSENNAGAQFYANGSSSYAVAGAKAYSALGSTGYGFHFTGQTTGAAWTACLAQDNNEGGAYFDGCQGYTVTGFVADSNGTTGTPQPAVIFGNSAQGNFIEFTAVDRNYNGAGNKQLYALNMDTASTGNFIACDAFYKTGGSSALSFFKSGSATGAGNALRIPGWTAATAGTSAGSGIQLIGGAISPGVVALADAATVSTDASQGNVFTVTLGGSRTMAAPSNPVDGQVIRYRVTQDTAGSHTLTWNGAFDFGSGAAPTLTTTANKTDIVAFEFIATTVNGTPLNKWAYLGASVPQGF